MKIKELFNFEDVQDVIEIGRIKDEKELIEKFVISENLEDELIELLDILKESKHKSVNVIGNYGTGKSHLLAFISLVLSRPEHIQYVQNENIKDKLNSLKREFLIVKYELPATQAKSLASIFFYRVRKQLKENYGIETRYINPNVEDMDTKELMEEILNTVKEKYPTKGLLVMFDEFSDFLKQKESTDRNYDLQFYRQLGECSNSMDFIFMTSMQEYIFTSEKYVDQAASIARTQQRYKDIIITNEDIEKMISKRVVAKNTNQLMELKSQFRNIEHHFSNLATHEDRYATLFPVHPYVIEVFSVLPFFEKRGIIQFLMREIKSIMEEDFPVFITYDLIYDNIDRIPVIKKDPEVKYVVEAVETLKRKIDLLDPTLRLTASKLVKALAILALVKSTKKNGASPHELANTLFILPSNKVLGPEDDIERILESLRQKADGEYIYRSKDGIYYLDSKTGIDYDIVIQNKVSNMNDLKYVNEKFVENFMLDELSIDYDALSISFFDSAKKYILNDSAYWESRKSFRKGKLVIDVGHDLDLEDDDCDYLFSILGYGVKSTKIDQKNQINLSLDYTDPFINSIKKLAAIEDFIRTKTHEQIMRGKKRDVIDKELRNAFKQALINSKISYNGKELDASNDLGISNDITADVFEQIKTRILDERFTAEYPEYPKLKLRLSAHNIKGTIESILQDISRKQGIVENLQKQSCDILGPMKLYKDNRLDISDSEYGQKIFDLLDDSDSNVEISKVLNLLTSEPYGLQSELVQLILAVLLRNGDIILSSKRGNIYSASDFNSLFNAGLKSFDDISYLKKEEELDVSKVQLLFGAIEEDGSLLQISKDRPQAYRNYMDKIDSVEKDIKGISDDFERLKQSIKIGLPIDELNDKIEEINSINYSILKIKSPVEFKKLDYSPERIEEIKNGYSLIKKLKSFFKDYFDYIKNGIGYMKDVVEVLDSTDCFNNSDNDNLLQIYNDSKDIITDIKKLLKEDERRPLKGKIDSFKRKYKEIYYHRHESFVGNKVDWQTLNDVENSDARKKLNLLQTIKCVNPTKFTEALLGIQNLKATKCTNFNVDELDNSTVCHCMFPKGTYDININRRISSMEEELVSILIQWESEIFQEILSSQEKIDNLDVEEKTIIQSIVSRGYLPVNIDSQVISSINNLLEDLEIKEIHLNKLYNKLTEDTDVLKVDDFMKKIDTYIIEILQSENKDNVRLKIKN